MYLAVVRVNIGIVMMSLYTYVWMFYCCGWRL